MRLTTKGRFAVTAMIDLAMRGESGPVALASISERQKISSFVPSMNNWMQHNAAVVKTVMTNIAA